MDRRVQQRVPVPSNIEQLRIVIEEEWDNIPQATINSLISSMWTCVARREASYLWPTDADLDSQLCVFHDQGQIYLFQLTDLFIWTVTQ